MPLSFTSHNLYIITFRAYIHTLKFLCFLIKKKEKGLHGIMDLYFGYYVRLKWTQT